MIYRLTIAVLFGIAGYYSYLLFSTPAEVRAANQAAWAEHRAAQESAPTDPQHLANPTEAVASCEIALERTGIRVETKPSAKWIVEPASKPGNFTIVRPFQPAKDYDGSYKCRVRADGQVLSVTWQ